MKRIISLTLAIIIITSFSICSFATEWFPDDKEVNLIDLGDTKSDSFNGESGIKNTEYKIDSGEWNIFTTSFKITKHGITTVYSRSTDNANNISDEKSLDIKIDKTPPTATVHLSTTDWTKEVGIEIIPSDDESGIKEVVNPLNEISTKTVAKENSIYTFKIINNVGRETIVNVPITNIEDKVNSFVVPSKDWANTPQTLGVSELEKVAPSGVSSVQYCIFTKNGQVYDVEKEEKTNLLQTLLDSISVKAYASEITTSTDEDLIPWKEYTEPIQIKKEGEFIAKFKATTNAGNPTPIVEAEIKNDYTPPVIIAEKEDYLIKLKVSDNLSGLDYVTLPNGENYTTEEIEFKPEKDGEYLFLAKDKAGNTLTYTMEVILPSESSSDDLQPIVDNKIVEPKKEMQVKLVDKKVNNKKQNLTDKDKQNVTNIETKEPTNNFFKDLFDFSKDKESVQSEYKYKGPNIFVIVSILLLLLLTITILINFICKKIKGNNINKKLKDDLEFTIDTDEKNRGSKSISIK